MKKIHDVMSQPFKAIAPSHLKGRICFAETQRLLADPKLFHRFFVKVIAHTMSIIIVQSDYKKVSLAHMLARVYGHVVCSAPCPGRSIHRFCQC